MILSLPLRPWSCLRYTIVTPMLRSHNYLSTHGSHQLLPLWDACRGAYEVSVLEGEIHGNYGCMQRYNGGLRGHREREKCERVHHAYVGIEKKVMVDDNKGKLVLVLIFPESLGEDGMEVDAAPEPMDVLVDTLLTQS
ncbi:hypothetical protein VNO77_05167 [Canavalia gladiata]|uniref:Uncharacterized protein n=1 Tax=Canavalia gladiata TaxID=3824 RepID=A0AAN9N4D2_CANGL